MGTKKGVKKAAKRPGKRAARAPRESGAIRVERVHKPITNAKLAIERGLQKIGSNTALGDFQQAWTILDALDARLRQHADKGKENVLTDHGQQMGELIDSTQEP